MDGVVDFSKQFCGGQKVFSEIGVWVVKFSGNVCEDTQKGSGWVACVQKCRGEAGWVTEGSRLRDGALLREVSFLNAT
jgi:hypothetical protein